MFPDILTYSLLEKEKIIKGLKTSLINNRNNYRTAVHLITGHFGLNKEIYNIRNLAVAPAPNEDTRMSQETV